MPEHEQLIRNYEHLAQLPGAADALHSLRKIASLVKPIMRSRRWHVGVLTEFYPSQTNLLGLNVNHGQKICLRLRYAGNQKNFLPMQEVIDTMLHELSHIVHGPHDEHFHALWNELRKEYEDLTTKGYTGEGFLSEGRRLGGFRVPMQEMRRQARVAAERRLLAKGSGRKLGGAAVSRGVDMRKVIADAASSRIDRTKGITQGCGSGKQGAENMADQASRHGFATKAEEDDANEQAMAQALWELVQEDEARKSGVSNEGWKSEGLTWDAETGLYPATLYSHFPTTFGSDAEPTTKKRSFSAASRPSSPPATMPKAVITTWPCPACTLVNSIDHLCCDACGSERPSEASTESHTPSSVPITHKLTRTQSGARLNEKSKERPQGKLKQKSSTLLHPEEVAQRAAMTTKLGWNCSHCRTFMESQWWTCTRCGTMKESS